MKTVVVSVTQYDIDQARGSKDPLDCPGAIALTRMFPEKRCSIGMRFVDGHVRYVALVAESVWSGEESKTILSAEESSIFNAYDLGGGMKPFSFVVHVPNEWAPSES